MELNHFYCVFKFPLFDIDLCQGLCSQKLTMDRQLHHHVASITCGLDPKSKTYKTLESATRQSGYNESNGQ